MKKRFVLPAGLNLFLTKRAFIKIVYRYNKINPLNRSYSGLINNNIPVKLASEKSIMFGKFI